MKKVVVYSEPLTRRFTVRRLSPTYILIVLGNIFTMLVPFYFCIGTDGEFWTTRGTYIEQPKVNFLYKFIMVLEATSKSTGKTKEIFFSTLDSANILRPESFRMAQIHFHEKDTNMDGSSDSFTLKANVPLDGDEEIRSMQSLLFFDFRLQKRLKFNMETIAYVSVESSLPMSGYESEGSLIFRQANPLGIRGYFSTLYADETPLVNDAEQNLAGRTENSNIGDILRRYKTRDVAADYIERYPVIRNGGNRTYNLNIKVKLPEQTISYIPSLMEVLKDAWIKYISILILFWVFLDRIKNFAFNQHLWVAFDGCHQFVFLVALLHLQCNWMQLKRIRFFLHRLDSILTTKYHLHPKSFE